MSKKSEKIIGFLQDAVQAKEPCSLSPAQAKILLQHIRGQDKEIASILKAWNKDREDMGLDYM